MNKQLVNLIGALASAAIVVLGVLVFALPLFTGAQTTASSADDVAAQNRAQQTLLDTLTAQSADMSDLEAQVRELRAEIPAAPHLDDVLLLAVQAAEATGGTVTAVSPTEPAAFAVRDGADEAAGVASVPADAAEAAPAETAAPDSSATAGGAAVAEADGPQQIGLTVTIDTPDVASATAALDALRAGPRLVAITRAAVVSGSESGVTLTATLLTFARP